MSFFAPSLQLFNKYVNFASVIALQAHTAYMWDVESRRSQVNMQSNKIHWFGFSQKNIRHFAAAALNNKWNNTIIISLWKSQKGALFITIGVAVVSQQSFWGVDGYWEAVSQSLVHCEDIHQVWEILCGTSGHDQRKGAWKKISVFTFCFLCKLHITAVISAASCPAALELF